MQVCSFILDCLYNNTQSNICLNFNNKNNVLFIEAMFSIEISFNQTPIRDNIYKYIKYDEFDIGYIYTHTY
jgi:hypothetical protein